jgi:CDP-4-dehydro-6-deoxyglucose reductase
MAFRIRIECTGQSFSTEPGETVIAAAQRLGVGLPYGCRNGSCGSCIGSLVSGSFHYPEGYPPALGTPTEFTDPVVLCQAVPTSDMVLRVRAVTAVGDMEIRRLPARAQNLHRLSHDVMGVTLKLPASEPFVFRAGQYIEFILRDGRRRAFSIANAPHGDSSIELHIRHVEGGSFTGHVFDEMHAKEMLRIEGPLGSFYLREDSARPLLLVGGGTGFAPLKSILEYMFDEGIERPAHLFWGAERLEDLYLNDLPSGWARSHENFDYTPVLMQPPPGWSGATGPVTEAVVGTFPDLKDFDIYISGPPAMVEAAAPLFAEHDADLAHMYSDAFEFAKDILDKLATARAGR